MKERIGTVEITNRVPLLKHDIYTDNGEDNNAICLNMKTLLLEMSMYNIIIKVSVLINKGKISIDSKCL